MNTEPIVNVHNVSKKLKQIQAVSDLSFTVYKKDIYGFLGPNGSGKSTTIRMMLSLLKADEGTIEIFGQSLNTDRLQILSGIGAFVENPNFYEYLSARKNLELLAAYSGIKIENNRIDETLELVGLLGRADSKVKAFSKGMKQRLGIAQALLHKPELLILDEPASGLDPSGMRDMRNLIQLLNKEKGISIILSSHNLQEIEHIANRMLIIHHGKKIVEGDVQELLSSHNYFTRFQVNNRDLAKQILDKSLFASDLIEVDGEGLRIQCKRNEVAQINKLLVENGVEVGLIKVEQNLEDYFLNIT